MRTTIVAVVLAVAAAPITADAGRKARLDLRASPRVAFSPANVLLTAELVGGDDRAEEYYCPAIEWNWDDGAKSVHEADCDPWQPGVELDRRFTATHAYRAAGTYRVTVTFRRADRAIAAANAQVTVHPGYGDPGASE